MAHEKVKRTIDSLKAIYAVIIGLAIKDAIEAIARDTVNSIPIKTFLLASFFSIAIPFFHGMNRHLDVYYIEHNENYRQKRGVLLFDFLAFFLEACFLFFSAINLSSGWLGLKFLGIMLIVDIIWGIVILLVLKNINSKMDAPNVQKWIWLNVIALLLGILVFILDCQFTLGIFISTMVICLLAIVRTFFDFKLSWSFYFSED